MSIASIVAGLIAITSYVPLWFAWRANRATSLWQAVLWAVAAWTAWLAAFFLDGLGGEAYGRVGIYLALSLTGCAGVAVLGARQPGLNAWNFVVLGLLAVFCLPLMPVLVNGQVLDLDGPRGLFLAGVLAVVLSNYLTTTRLAGIVLSATVVLAIQWVSLTPSAEAWKRSLGPRNGMQLLIAIAPWVVWFNRLGVWHSGSEADWTWLTFRDRFGAVWGLRIQDQFNRAAVHAGLPARIDWNSGVVLDSAEKARKDDESRALELLQALVKRFRAQSNQNDGASTT